MSSPEASTGHRTPLRDRGTVLVATSTDPACDGPVRAAGRLAEALGARLEIVHGLGREGFTSGPFGTGWIDDAKVAPEVPRRRDRIRRQLARCGLPEDWANRATIRPGSAQVVVADRAREEPPDLLVIGAPHGIGSVVDRVVRTSRVPLLVARPTSSGIYRSALLATDLSIPSRDAIVRAGMLFRSLPDPPSRTLLFAIESLTNPPSDPETWDEQRREAIAELARLLEDLEGPDRVEDAEWAVFPGEPCAVIRSQAPDYDLVVLGTHGLGGFHRFLVGSVVLETIRSTSVDVLVIPTGAVGQSWPPDEGGP